MKIIVISDKNFKKAQIQDNMLHLRKNRNLDNLLLYGPKTIKMSI